MKTKILLLIAFISLLGFKQSFAGEVFPTSDAIWVIHMYNNGTYQYVYGLSGDTLINEQTYQKLYLLNDTTLTITHEDIYVAGIRQTDDKKVWIQPADKKDGSVFEEFLMYDFEKNVGDLIIFGKYPQMGWNYNDPTFENIEQENVTEKFAYIANAIESEYGIKYMIVGDIGGDWIKGIGSLSGLFFMPFDYAVGRGFQGCELVCMKEKNEIKYILEDCTSCFNKPFYGTGIEDEITSNCSVHYDTEQNSIIIKSDNVSSSIIFKLIRLDGITLCTDVVSEAYTSVNISNLSKGIYIYNITGDNINQSGKLIIK